MPKNVNAFIKLKLTSEKQTITVEEIKELFEYYEEITSKTGEQLDWDYSGHAFPYKIKEKEEAKGQWFYLTSNLDRYNIIVVAVDQEKIIEDDVERIQNYIQITLPESSTFGDKTKANEYCKFLAKKLKGELHMFNKRIIYYYPRK